MQYNYLFERKDYFYEFKNTFNSLLKLLKGAKFAVILSIQLKKINLLNNTYLFDFKFRPVISHFIHICVICLKRNPSQKQKRKEEKEKKKRKKQTKTGAEFYPKEKHSEHFDFRDVLYNAICQVKSRTEFLREPMLRRYAGTKLRDNKKQKSQSHSTEF